MSCVFSCATDTSHHLQLVARALERPTLNYSDPVVPEHPSKLLPGDSFFHSTTIVSCIAFPKRSATGRNIALCQRYGSLNRQPREAAACRQSTQALSRHQVWHPVSHRVQSTSSFDATARDICANKAPSRSNQDISNQAVTEISNRLLYDIENNRAPYKNGPLDIQLVRCFDPTKSIPLLDKRKS